MIKVYQDNGLPFYDTDWISDRWYVQHKLESVMMQLLRQANPAWVGHEIEAPALMPDIMLNPEYESDDVYMSWSNEAKDDVMVLRPETTASSYAYAQYLLEHQQAKPPLCVYQAGRSYRRENDQVSKNVRLKEFYQMEFQCIVTEDTKMDYQNPLLLVDLANTVERLTGCVPRIGSSDRLPSYSDKTTDIEVLTVKGKTEKEDKWLEVASISKRHDVPFEWSVQKPSAGVPVHVVTSSKKLINYEFAFGLDRLVHAMRA